MDAGFDPTANKAEQGTTFQTYTMTPAEKEHDKKATLAMVLGIIGDACFFPPLLDLVGLTLSILALVRANANRRFAREMGITEDGKNIAARWCGIGGIVMNGLSILFWLFIIVLAVISAAVLFDQVGTNMIGVIPEIF